LRTWGRVNGVWQEVVTDPVTGSNDAVWLTTLLQVLKLNLGEDPFNANYGIPAQQSVIQQIFPDFYVAQIQQQFAQYFSSLIIAKVPGQNAPYYTVNVILHSGVKISEQVPV